MPARCLVIIHSKQLQGIRHQQGLSHRPFIWENWWKGKRQWGKKSMPFTNVICQIELSSMGSRLCTRWESELKESVYSKHGSWAGQVREPHLASADLQFLGQPKHPVTSVGLGWAEGVQNIMYRTLNLIAPVPVVNLVSSGVLTCHSTLLLFLCVAQSIPSLTVFWFSCVEYCRESNSSDGSRGAAAAHFSGSTSKAPLPTDVCGEPSGSALMQQRT